MLQRLVILLMLAVPCVAQSANHAEIPVSREVLARYVGTYAVAPRFNLTITLVDGRLMSQMTGQGMVPLLPESATTFSLSGTKTTIEFPKEQQGQATQLILHQNGRDATGKRLSDAEAKQIADAAAAFDKRFKDQTAAPGTDAAVRVMLAELQAGTPNYERLTPAFADLVRQHLTEFHDAVTRMGTSQSVIFKGVGPGGADIYQLNFEKGSMDGRIWLDPDGKIERLGFSPSDYFPPPMAATAESLHAQLTEIDSKIAAEVARHPVGSVTVGVVVGKQLLWTKSYGDADREKKIPADAETVYRIGSITKMFTAVMLDQLVEAGKVHLSDPVEKYFPEIREVQGRFPGAPPITLIQLATHTSGLDREPDDIEIATAGPAKDWERTLIAALPHLRYQFEPGTRFFYSNMGYAILGAALSRAAGESYLDYVPRHIFQPLGMTHSALELNPQILQHLSKGYVVMGPGGRVDAEIAQRENENGRGYKVPNGAIYTTVGDLARFASFLLGQGPESVLKAASLDHVQRELMVPANMGLTTGYGVGFQVDRHENYVAFGHGGSVAGYTAMLLMNREKGVGVIALSNGEVDPGRGMVGHALDILSK
ncbi:MAG TPA: serine hydrolase [Acidobacteriaceae bacterium]|jgi:D-alanyl-D-alanine carboxypeptidase